MGKDVQSVCSQDRREDGICRPCVLPNPLADKRTREKRQNQHKRRNENKNRYHKESFQNILKQFIK